MYLYIAVYMANSVDPDQTPRFAASDLGPQCLQKKKGLYIPIIRVIMVFLFFDKTYIAFTP